MSELQSMTDFARFVAAPVKARWTGFAPRLNRRGYGRAEDFVHRP